MSVKREPHYELEWVKAAVSSGRYVVTARVLRYLRRRGLPPDSPARCIGAMVSADFHKSQLHRERNGIWLDIYRPVIAGTRWYVKLALYEDGIKVVVLSCCRDGEPH